VKDAMRTTYSSKLLLHLHLWKHSLAPDTVELSIFRTDTLKEMSIRVPRTKEELLDINGIGK
jgi:superfamily II DNA helicase RecQ